MSPENQNSTAAKWAREAPIEEVCIHVADTYLKDSHSLDGSLLANLAARIIACEIQPGGPYKNTLGIIDPHMNLAICYLFTALKKPLAFTDPFLRKVRSHSSASLKTKALLAKFDQLAHTQANTVSMDAVSEKSYRLAKKEFDTLQRPARNLALSFLERLQSGDKNREITLIPTLFFESLTHPNITPPLVQLGEANIYCWIAYTIYDHILDDKPFIEYLPLANIAMRLALRRYQSLFPSNHPFQQKIIDTFTNMDAANSWELHHCRFLKTEDTITISRLPSYGRLDFLARRSFGHALGPLAITTILPHTPQQAKSVEKALCHYLIARQLSDDIHDWQEDIRAGHSSAVVTHILKNQAIKPGLYPLDPLVEKMQADFWLHSMQATNVMIRHHTSLAKYHFARTHLLKEEGGILNLITRLEAVAIASSNEKKRYEAFSATYRSSLVQ